MSSTVTYRHQGAGPLDAQFKVGGQVWNGSALVATSTIADADWADTKTAASELLTSDGTSTLEHAVTLPSIPVEGGVVFVSVLFFSAGAAPDAQHVGQAGVWWDGTNIVGPPIITAAARLADLVALVDLLEADRVIDTTVVPWAVVLIKRGSGSLGQPEAVELLRQELFDVSGGPISDVNTVLGRSVS